MQNANNPNILFVVAIEDHMALVEKAAVARSDIIHSATHIRIVAESLKAMG